MKVRTGRGLPKITLGMMELRGNLGRDDGIEEPFWGPSTNIDREQSLFSQSKFGGTGESEMAERETGDRLLAVFYDYDPAFLFALWGLCVVGHLKGVMLQEYNCLRSIRR